MGSRKDWKLVLVRYVCNRWSLFPSPSSPAFKDLMGGGAHTIVTRKSRRPCFCLLVSLPVFDIHHAPGNGHDFRQSCVPGFWSYSSGTFFRAIHCSLIGLCFSRARHDWTPYVESVPWVPSAQNHLRKCHHFWLPAQWVIGMRVYDFNRDVVNGPKDTCISNHRNTEDGFQPEKPFWKMCYRGPAIQ